MRRTLLLVLCLFSFGAGRLRAQSVPAELINYPETIFFNGKVITMNDAGAVAQGVAVHQGKLLAIDHGRGKNSLRVARPSGAEQER